jgi:hypothetical protein
MCESKNEKKSIYWIFTLNYKKQKKMNFSKKWCNLYTKIGTKTRASKDPFRFSLFSKYLKRNIISIRIQNVKSDAT